MDQVYMKPIANSVEANVLSGAASKYLSPQRLQARRNQLLQPKADMYLAFLALHPEGAVHDGDAPADLAWI
jgi:hypothetical protein